MLSAASSLAGVGHVVARAVKAAENAIAKAVKAAIQSSVKKRP